MKRAILAGASGLVGGHLLELMLADNRYDEVVLLGRRELPLQHSKLVQRKVDFEKLHELEISFAQADVYCTLGTTIKKAGSQDAFRQVDYVYPYALAQKAKEEEASQFLIITALGANASSGVFYNRVKGELEKALQQMKLRSLHIFRPSLLLGDRKEFRLGERAGAVIGKGISFAMTGKLRRYRPIQAMTVACAMYNVATTESMGMRAYESDEIEKLGKTGRELV
ncbi:oxidoreductase [Marinicrinis sediminis]|uniref:Oxidoreductase n=1 Tax=Marinicrinis sediminis TaxID=1652465 RepID=A0ABW5R8C2_9BACL